MKVLRVYVVCSRVHNIINKLIQDAKARDIKVFNRLPLANLLKNYFDTKPLHIYAANAVVLVM